MRKRFKRLKKTLKALDVNVGDESEETLKEIQAGVFLAQLMSQNESGRLDLTGQTGYFFKWHDGPHASSLSEAYRDLVNYMRFENATNGYEVEEPSLVDHARRICEVVSPFHEVSRADWLQTLAVVAYLRAAADWEQDPARQEAESVLPSHTADKFDVAEEQVRELGLLDAPDPVTA